MIPALKELIILAKENTSIETKTFECCNCYYRVLTGYFRKDLLNSSGRQKRDKARSELKEGLWNCSRTLFWLDKRAEILEKQIGEWRGGYSTGSANKEGKGKKKQPPTHLGLAPSCLYHAPSLHPPTLRPLPKFPLHWIISTWGSNEKKKI